MTDLEKSDLTFHALSESIQQAHKELASQASKAVNVSLTLRNWLIGHYISEYQLKGEDRASYGEKLLEHLSKALKSTVVTACGHRQLYNYLRLYQTYPQISRSLTAKLQNALPQGVTTSEEIPDKIGIKADMLLQRLSYTHIEQLVFIEEEIKRAFYEIECLKGNWSVRELKRQIGSLYYERAAYSLDKKKLSKLANKNAEILDGKLNIRDPYVFEFLGLNPQEVLNENELETHLIKKLEAFLLEMGNGFCFEGRQKRILIGHEYFFVDLVFYHRVLKCHVLIELKTGGFTHESVGQLNTYVSWYKDNMMTEGDNPPIGILLCTKKDNQALVEYALAGMDSQLFISKYQMELPKKEKIQNFIDEEVKEYES